MENHKNIKYKKKYNKYKNKYYKLTKNKIYGGTIEPTTIATVAGIIALLVALGYYVYDKNDSISQEIKDFFNLSDNRVKNNIKRLQNEQKQAALKEENAQKRQGVDSNTKKFIKGESESESDENEDDKDFKSPTESYYKNKKIKHIKKVYENTLILLGEEKKKEVLQKLQLYLQYQVQRQIHTQVSLYM